MSSESIQAHDGIPNAVARDFRGLLERYLPGWSVDGEYNYRASASTQRAAVQLETIMHSGSHPWINDALDNLLNGFEQKVAPDARSERLAQLVNYIHESQNLDNLNPNGKTGGYVAFTSRNDPYWLDFQANNPEFAGDDGIRKYHNKFLNNFDDIASSQAGKDVAKLNIKTVPINGSNSQFKLEYDGKLDNGGFFSKTSDKLNEFDKLTSSKFSANYAEQNNIKALDNGTVSVNGKQPRIDFANDFVARELPDGTLISSHEKVPSKLLSSLGKFGAAGLLLSVSFLALSATEAHGAENYDSERPNDANKGFISELIALTVGELAGLVAGALAGLASFGALAIPAVIVVSEVAERFGRQVGEFFYDTYTDSANAAAEYLAPLFDDLADAAIDFGSAVYNFAADVFTLLEDTLFSADGLFGLNGPLFGEDGPLQFAASFLGDQEILTNEGIWTYDSFDKLIEGTDADDVLVHDGYGGARGGKGDDVLIGFRPEFIAKGDPLFSDDPNSPLATEDQRLTLDGGEGDDWVITFGGTGAITIGGEGRDFIFNTSAFGQIYGDTLDGLDSDGNPLDHTGSENADTFWFWPGTFIKDAQPNDRITLFGLPLVGGSNAVGGVAAGDGSLALDFFNFTFAYGSTFGGQLLIINRLAQILGIGPSLGPTTPLGTQVVENYDFGGFSDENYGRAAPGDLGLTFRIFLPADRAIEGVVISLFNAVWGSLFTVLDAAEQLAKLNLFFFIPPQPSRKYCN